MGSHPSTAAGGPGRTGSFSRTGATKSLAWMPRLGRTFDTLIDCGPFHVFSDSDRERYVSSIAMVTAPGSEVVILCFSDLQPGDYGPRRVKKEEILQAFQNDGWKVENIRAAVFETNAEGDPIKAWLCQIVRAPSAFGDRRSSRSRILGTIAAVPCPSAHRKGSHGPRSPRIRST